MLGFVGETRQPRQFIVKIESVSHGKTRFRGLWAQRDIPFHGEMFIGLGSSEGV